MMEPRWESGSAPPHGNTALHLAARAGDTAAAATILATPATNLVGATQTRFIVLRLYIRCTPATAWDPPHCRWPPTTAAGRW